MRPLRYRWVWLGGGVLALILILVLALLPMTGPMPFQISDKLAHCAAFIVLMGWFMGVFELALAWRVALMLLAYGLAIELLQSFTSFRTADPLDVVADTVGIGGGWLLASAGLHRWCGRVESWLGPASP